MTNVLKSKIAKAGLGLLAGAGLLLGASSAFALTASDISMLQAAGIISASQAASLLASVGGTTSTGTCYTFNTNLSMGMTSSDVMNLQKVLNSNSATALTVAAGSNGSAGHETSFFGGATKAAVMKFQALKGISPVAGFVGSITRGVLNNMCVTTSDGVVTTTPPVTTGPVSAMLALNNPSSGTLVAGQATGDLAHFAFTGTGVVTGLTLMKTGVSSNDTLSNVYLYDGGARLTDAASVTSGGVITFANPSGLFTVTGSKVISVRADIKSGTSGQTVGVNLTGFTTSGATSATMTNLMGNVMTIAATTDLATAVITATNTVSSAVFVDAGTSNYTIWGNTLSIGQRAVWLKGANFRVIGSAESGALQNARLVIDGAQVGAAVASVTANGTLSFDLSATPFSLTTGTHTVEIRADVVGGANRNFYVSLQNASDLMLEDSQYHVNLMLETGSHGSPTLNAYNMATGGNSATISINQGTLSLTKDTTFSSTTNVTSGASNVTLARYNLKSYGEGVKVMQAVVGIDLGATAGTYIQNVTVYANGAPVATSQTVDSDPDTLTFNLSSLVVPAGTTVPVEVRADLMNTSGTNFAGTIATTFTIPQYQAQGTSSYSLYPTTSSGLTTSSTTVTAGAVSATFAKAAAYTNQTIATNVDNQKIGSFVMQAGTTEGVRVTNLSVALSGTVTTTFVDSGSSALNSTGSKTINVASTSGMSVGDSVTVETGATDYLGTIATVASATQITTTSTTAGTTDPTTDGAAVTVTPISTSTAIPSNLSNLYLKVNGVALSSAPVNPQLTNNFTTDFTVPAGQSQTVDVYANTGSRTGTVVTTVTPTARGSSSNTVVTDFDPVTGGPQTAIAGQTITLGTGTIGAGSVVSMTTSTAHYVVGGSSTESIIRYNFTSTNGASTIKELWFTTGGTAGAITAITATGTNGGTCTSTPVGTTVHLTGCNILVPQGFGGSDIIVNPTYNAVSYTGVASDSTATVNLTDINSMSGGVETGQTAVTLATSNTMTLVASLPVVALNSASTLLSTGQVKVGSVTITAGAGNVQLTSLPFRIAVSGGADVAGTAGSDVVLKEGSATITSTDDLAADDTTTADVTVTFSSTQTVTANTSRTFDIYVTAEAVTGGDDSVTVQLAPASGFVWNDVNGGGTGETGTLILNFPTNTIAISS